MRIDLQLERLLPAPPEDVFAAFTDPDRLRRWWGPAGFTVPGLDWQPAAGAAYRIAMQPPESDVFHLRGRFHAVDPPHGLVFTFDWEEPDPDDVETLVTLRLEPGGRGTSLLLEQGPFATAARRELHRDGWTETLDRLERSLASQASA